MSRGAITGRGGCTFEEELLKRGYIIASDFNLFERVESVDDAVAKIDRFYRRYHSIRYVEKLMVIRLSSNISPECVGELSSRFQNILTPGGKISISGALPEEADEPEISELPRLLVDFNRKDMGRLRSLIDAINSC